jgi:hypothetical protein
MFFYYKRNAMETIPNGASASGVLSMPLRNYVVPIPESEIDNRM